MLMGSYFCCQFFKALIDNQFMDLSQLQYDKNIQPFNKTFKVVYNAGHK